jgi:integrase
VNYALTDLRHFFTWAIRHDHYTAGNNPVDGIDFEGVKEKSSEVYTDADLKAIFTHPAFLREKASSPARYWLPWILLYTGARRSEIDQLDLSDIRQDDTGVWFFDLRFNEEKGTRLKNESSIRRVPVHSQLIALGLLDYVASLRKGKETTLFKKIALDGSKRGKGRSTVGDAVGKWFARMIQARAKVTGKKTLHSFRHTVITRLTAAGVPQDMREMLVGHASESVHGQVYTHRDAIPLALLKEHLDKLQYKL